MIAPHELSAAIQSLPVAERAQMAVELLDSLGDEARNEDELAEERDAELESGEVEALTHEQFIAGLRRPGVGS